MPYCRECGSEVPPEDNFCGSCGAELHKEAPQTSQPPESDAEDEGRWDGTRLPGMKSGHTRRNFLVASGYGLGAVAVIGALGSAGESGSGGGLKILDHHWFNDEYQSGVRGRAKNTSGGELSYAEIEVTFLDSSGAQIESFIDNTNGLGAGRVWRFEVIYPGLDSGQVADYEIEASTSL